MGFGSAKKPNTVESALICTRCHALFFKPVKTDCQHYFCRACITPCRDCLICGADVGSLTAEPKLEELVELFMGVCGDNAAFEAAASLRFATGYEATEEGSQGASQPDTKEGSSADQHDSQNSGEAMSVKDAAARVDYMLECALRSMTGGNFAAAAARFGRCRERSVSVAEAAGEGGWSEDGCCRLGDICGSQGVCEQRLENAEAAESCFKDSIRFLEKSPVRSSQVAHALAVSHNKLGDLHYSGQNHELARCSYRDALSIRQHSYDTQGQGDGGSADVSAALNLVTSLLKVADIEEVLGDQEAASKCLARADDVLVSVSGSIEPGSAAEAKHRGLQEFRLKLVAPEPKLDDLNIT